MGTLPSTVYGSPVRAALEGLLGFPSLHKTLFDPDDLVSEVGAMFRVRTGLKYLESEIDTLKLRAVESPERCQDAVVVELRRR